MGCLLLAAILLSAVGCSSQRERPLPHPVIRTPRTVAVPPVLNLSNAAEVDGVQVADMLAGELLDFPGVAVVPVNITLAALDQRGLTRVQTPEDALRLAADLNADAVVVGAVTQYRPYDPPRIGMVLQWYDAPLGSEQPLSAVARQPRVQVQHEFDGSQERLLRDVRSYGDEREGHRSPYAWRKHLVSQELFLRYCCHASIRSMLGEQSQGSLASPVGEAEQ